MRVQRMRASWVLATVVAVALTGCSWNAKPAEADVDAAALLRPVAVSALESLQLTATSDSTVAGDRTIDVCGSLTSDRGGFDDRHIEGYECVVTRLVLVVQPVAGDASDLPLQNLRDTLIVENGLSSGPVAPDRYDQVDFALGGGDLFDAIRAGDTRVTVSIIDLDPSSSRYSVPTEDRLYHSNEVVISTSGRLDDATLSAALRSGANQGVLFRFQTQYYNSVDGPRG